ncbi:hypothetical protein F8M41_010839 [Gigaspora margarita]|uniref:Uncharacterized protein n=1 Tax=Gigaspora margarita TaxID=4874 RepID=A0A8H4AU72_GIGMA|nr:hypothetical protein F8M41_010839 [Gigaspora margarita]
MVQYEITPQYLLPTSENFITIDPILSNTFLDPQPVDKFQYFVQGFDSGSVENFPTNGIMEMVVEIMKMVEMVEQVLY